VVLIKTVPITMTVFTVAQKTNQHKTQPKRIQRANTRNTLAMLKYLPMWTTIAMLAPIVLAMDNHTTETTPAGERMHNLLP
jgi:hypothetical protein